MDKIRYPVLTEKTIRLLEKNKYNFDVNIKSNKREIRESIEIFFGVKILSINSYRLPKKKKKVSTITGYTISQKRMIITLGSGYSILLFSSK